MTPATPATSSRSSGASPGSSIIEVEGLTKSFGSTQALTGVDLVVPRGAVVGLLGPNGAGKTTTVRILATLLRPDGGRALVDGHDVVEEPDAVRSVIGLTGQYAAVDEKLTGAENLQMVGRLLGLSRAHARRRADDLLERFGLTDAGDRAVETYSGGMRRRVDLAVSIVGRPTVLFLDEPTTGLDPASRMGLWDVTRELVAEGTTVLLTTQYLEEADELADSVVVIDRGTVIAEGTTDELKDRLGGRRLVVELPDRDSAEAAAVRLRTRFPDLRTTCDAGTRSLQLEVGADTALAAAVVASLDEDRVEIVDFHLERPSLDDVFLALTGHRAEEDPPDSDDSPTRNGSPTLDDSPGGSPTGNDSPTDPTTEIAR